MIRLLRRLFDAFAPKRLHLWASARMSRNRVRSFGPNVSALLTVGYNGRLLVPPGDLVVGAELAWTGSWDKSRIEFLLRILQPEWRALVIGAHIGSLLVPLARRVAYVTGIEPNPETFELLKANVLLNGLSNVQVENWAAGDRLGKVSMLCNHHNTGGSKIAQGDSERPEFTYDSPSRVEVEMRTVDCAFPSAQFQLAVIDAEGAEALVLRGMKETLSGVDFLQMEISPFHLKHLTGMSAVELVHLAGAHFDFALLDEGGTSPIYSSDQFTAMAEDLGGRGWATDVMFFKATVEDAVRRALLPIHG